MGNYPSPPHPQGRRQEAERNRDVCAHLSYCQDMLGAFLPSHTDFFQLYNFYRGRRPLEEVTDSITKIFSGTTNHVFVFFLSLQMNCTTM